MNTDAKLTKRERQVMRLLKSGKVSKDIAVELNLSNKTVGVHKYNLFRKLGVHRVKELRALNYSTAWGLQ